MQDNDLKLNQDKTDVSLIHSKLRNGVSLDHIILVNGNISITELVTNLGIIFGNMTFDDQIKNLCKASFFHARNMFRISRYLTSDCASKVIHAFITSRIDYSNHLYYGLPKYQLNKIQRTQNTAVPFVPCKGKFDHVTRYLCSFIGFLYFIVLCSSFCCWCTSLSMVSVHHMFLIYSRSSHHQDIYVLAIWTILYNVCQRQRPMRTERFLCAHRSCGTVFPFVFVNLAPYLFLRRTLRLFYFQNRK